MSNRVKFLLTCLIFAGILSFFIYHVNIPNFIDTLANISIIWLMLGFLFFLLQLALGALRFKYLLNMHSMKEIFGIQCATSIFKCILPANLGELSILYLFKKFLKVKYTQSTSALFIVRVLDIFLFATFFYFLYIYAYDLFYNNAVMKYAMMLMLILIFVLLLICFFILFKENFVKRILSLSFFNKYSLGLRLKNFTLNFQFYFKDALSLKVIIPLIILSILMWASFYFVIVARCKAIHANLSCGEVLFVFLILCPFRLFPMKGAGDLGSYELGWGIGLSLLGYPFSRASLIALGTHTITYMHLALVMIVILIFYNQRFIKWFLAFKNRKE